MRHCESLNKQYVLIVDIIITREFTIINVTLEMTMLHRERLSKYVDLELTMKH